ncbi:hypothetical protein V6x_20220 [Gimesia chilikensis]|uniref:Uncharacterized protein n=1 Tax=Gimesia chilikensis TaxID=2605989 RepID=A0A517WAN6_9PLAN|nr:hypothetical protein V6x_20220 [Gimesia chilikensis]
MNRFSISRTFSNHFGANSEQFTADSTLFTAHSEQVNTQHPLDSPTPFHKIENTTQRNIVSRLDKIRFRIVISQKWLQEWKGIALFYEKELHSCR